MSKRYKKSRISREENSRAKNMFIFLVSLLFWMILLSTAGVVKLLIEGSLVNYFYAIIIPIIMILMGIGIIATLKHKYPFQYFLLLGVGLNAAISFPTMNKPLESYIIHFPLSCLILYLGIRFPLVKNIQAPLLK